VTQQKIIGIPQVYSFSLKFEVHSFFGSLNVYVKERANTFQFASLGRKADSLLSAQNKPKTEAHPYVGLPPNTRRSGQAADDNIADIGPLCEYRKMEGKHILAIVLGALVAGIAIEARVKK
jgi:hypothetical protein